MVHPEMAEKKDVVDLSADTTKNYASSLKELRDLMAKVNTYIVPAEREGGMAAIYAHVEKYGLKDEFHQLRSVIWPETQRPKQH